MKRIKIFFLMIVSVLFLTISAKSVSFSDAEIVAKNKLTELNENFSLKSNLTLENKEQNSIAYIFNLAPQGYLVDSCLFSSI